MTNAEPTQKIDQLLQQAAAHHQAGRYAEAEELYLGVLQAAPRHPDANHNLGLMAMQLDKAERGLPYLQAAWETDPSTGQYWLTLAECLLEMGHIEDARLLLEEALRRGMESPQARQLLVRVKTGPDNTTQPDESSGKTVPQQNPDTQEIDALAALFNDGRHAEAENLARALTERFPLHGFGWKVLGALFKQAGRNADALAPMQKAAALSPDDAEAHNNLAVALKDLGRLSEAEAGYRRALQIKPDYAEAYSNLGNTLKELGRLEEGLSYYRKALEISLSSLTARQGIHIALSSMVPQWHVPMMNEQRRNNAYFEALKSAITPESGVFEIGTGSGLLAMMSAKLGAKQVTTCEAVPLIAETAQHIVADNGYEKSVKVISKRSTSVEVGEDLPQKADILVSEILSSELLGEYVLHSIEDAKRRLLKPNGRIIPAAGSIMIALFSGKDIGSCLIVEDSFGFNLQRFNSIVSKKQLIERNDMNVEMLSDDIEAFSFDFENESFFPSQSKILRIPIRSPGRCYGVIQWIRLQMDKQIIYENHPSGISPVSGWQHCVYVFPEPVDVRPGQIAVVAASHNRTVPWFYLDGIEQS